MKTSVTLSTQQLQLLLFIAKFRFVTIADIQTHFGLSSRGSVHTKCRILLEHGYIAAQYDKSYKLIARSAAYYLTPKGLRAIQPQAPYITDSVIKNAYSDTNANQQFVDSCFTICRLALSLQNAYPTMKVLTARQLADFDYFPRPLPGLYLANIEAGETRRYFLYYLKNVTRYDIAVRACLQKLISYRESGEYDISGNEFPTILFVCDSAAIEQLVRRLMPKLLNRSFESLDVLTTSTTALLETRAGESEIWTTLDDDALCDLTLP